MIPVHSIMELECRIIVAGDTLIVLCLCRIVVDVAHRCCMLEDTSEVGSFSYGIIFSMEFFICLGQTSELFS